MSLVKRANFIRQMVELGAYCVKVGDTCVYFNEERVQPVKAAPVPAAVGNGTTRLPQDQALDKWAAFTRPPISDGT